MNKWAHETWMVSPDLAVVVLVVRDDAAVVRDDAAVVRMGRSRAAAKSFNINIIFISRIIGGCVDAPRT